MLKDTYLCIGNNSRFLFNICYKINKQQGQNLSDEKLICSSSHIWCSSEKLYLKQSNSPSVPIHIKKHWFLNSAPFFLKHEIKFPDNPEEIFFFSIPYGFHKYKVLLKLTKHSWLFHACRELSTEIYRFTEKWVEVFHAYHSEVFFHASLQKV